MKKYKENVFIFPEIRFIINLFTENNRCISEKITLTNPDGKLLLRNLFNMHEPENLFNDKRHRD